MELTHLRFHGRSVVSSTSVERAGAAVTTSRRDDSAAADGLPAFLLHAAGLDSNSYRRAPLQRRTAACLRALRASSDEDARARVQASPFLREVAIGALLIGVSDFFRDGEAFRALQDVALPALADTGRPLRVLSLGCSSGAELYSVAMLLAETDLLARSTLVGADVRGTALAAARAGVFQAPAVARLDLARQARHGAPVPGGWRVHDAIRTRTAWITVDATRACPPGPWDLILCRNLFIYLRDEVVRATASRLAAALAPHGFVVLGKAERLPAELALTEVTRGVYCRPC